MADITLPTTGLRTANEGSSVGVVCDVTLGGTIAAGSAFYIDSNGKAQKADADAGDTANALGVLYEGGSSNDVCCALLFGVLNGLAGLTKGADVYVSTTAGAYTQAFDGGLVANGDFSEGDYPTKLGTAISATQILINPVRRLVALTAGG